MYICGQWVIFLMGLSVFIVSFTAVVGWRLTCKTSATLPKVVFWDTTRTTTTTTILQLSGFCPVQPRWDGTGRNIHPLTPLMVISHPLSTSSIYYHPWHPPCSTYVPESLFAQSLSKLSLVYLLVWHPALHTPYISSPNHCLPHAHTIATCFAVVPRLCHLILVYLLAFTWMRKLRENQPTQVHVNGC